MFKGINEKLWVFDIEWAPDPAAGRRLYGLPAELSDREVIEEMFRQGGATEENPRPFLRMALCQVLSIVALVRNVKGDDVSLHLTRLPHLHGGDVGEGLESGAEEGGHSRALVPGTEAEIIHSFLNAVGKHTPQLVGFNSREADIKILIQRATILGVPAKEFFFRPEKPWLGVDYFDRWETRGNVDLMEILGGRSGASVSLHQICTLCGIPGKQEGDGESVVEYWLSGDMERIQNYNECDVLSTYLLWLRLAFVSGHVTRAGYDSECEKLKALLTESGAPHLKRYLAAWEGLSSGV